MKSLKKSKNQKKSKRKIMTLTRVKTVAVGSRLLLRNRAVASTSNLVIMTANFIRSVNFNLPSAKTIDLSSLLMKNPVTNKYISISKPR